MKSKSPFKAKVDIFQGSTSTYRHPSTVIQPIVGAQVGAKIAKTAAEVTAITAKSKKPKKNPETETKTDNTRVTNITNNFGSQDNLDNSSSSGQGSRSGKKTSTVITGGKSYKQAYSEAGLPGETYSQYVDRAEKWHKDNPGNRPSSTITTTSSSFRENFNTKIAAAQMKGSPAKQIDPYAEINPEAVPGTQAQNVLGAQPIVGADLNQARNVDMQAMIDPYKSPGATFKPGEKLKAENIYGQAGQRQALMNLGSPMHAHTPTHGKKYKKGDLIDESDFETLGTGYNVQNISDIQEDKKGQFMTTLGDSEIYSDRPRPTSKKIDYPNPKSSVRDTIRPKVGKFFKRS